MAGMKSEFVDDKKSGCECLGHPPSFLQKARKSHLLQNLGAVAQEGMNKTSFSLAEQDEEMLVKEHLRYDYAE